MAKEIWQYDERGTQYKILSLCDMKLQKSEWEAGVIYYPVGDTSITYTRDLETFLTKFSRVKQ